MYVSHTAAQDCAAPMRQVGFAGCQADLGKALVWVNNGKFSYGGDFWEIDIFQQMGLFWCRFLGVVDSACSRWSYIMSLSSVARLTTLIHTK